MSDRKPLEVSLRGRYLIQEPLLNKGSAFSAAERRAFGLEGMLPYRSISIEQQADRIYKRLGKVRDPFEKYVALSGLQDRNECLYFFVLQKYLEELMPIVYTPTVGQATQKFSHVFQRGRGLWISPDMKGRVEDSLLRAASGRDIRLIVATDNESILGIGDQGAGGMAISIGKLSLYTAGAGIDPASVLPVSLDVGTENESLLSDPLYLGWPQRRLRGTQYDELIDEFVTAVTKVFPGAIVQWEDFRKDNALRILNRYRDTLPSFNDDIQGTGAVALAGILSAGYFTGRSIADERVIILGAGAAGLGIARQIRSAMKGAGMPKERRQTAVAVLDSRGLIVDDGSVTDEYKLELAWSPESALARGLDPGKRSLGDVVAALEPTVLIGSSGQRGVFTSDILRQVAAHVEQPLIFPLSNPTDNSEATPEDIVKHTEGRALIATGSPFPDVKYGDKLVRVGQGNNVFIFPGIGLALMVAGICKVTDNMLSASAGALANSVSDDERKSGMLYPPISRLREVSLNVAEAVIQAAADEGLCDAHTADTAPELLKSGCWEPEYPEYVAVG